MYSLFSLSSLQAERRRQRGGKEVSSVSCSWTRVMTRERRGELGKKIRDGGEQTNLHPLAGDGKRQRGEMVMQPTSVTPRRGRSRSSILRGPCFWFFTFCCSRGRPIWNAHGGVYVGVSTWCVLRQAVVRVWCVCLFAGCYSEPSSVGSAISNV